MTRPEPPKKQRGGLLDRFAGARAAGEEMYGWACDLFPLNRSLTGPGVRETLAYLQRLLPDLQVRQVASGTKAFDWTVPDEWRIRDAYIADERGERIVDFRRHNLHVVGYSVPVDATLSREELDAHLHSLPEQPDAIPYVTSYYAPRWGFCLPHRQRAALPPGRYRAVIDSELKPGMLNYGELFLPGESDREVLISTYICHPSMANNELSGPAVAAALGRWLCGLRERQLSYRILFTPETIGAIVYLSRHLEHMKGHTVAGFVLTCMGDDRGWSHVPSRLGGTLADRVARHVLEREVGAFTAYSYLDRHSDERQYCSPGVDLPVVTISRSYVHYPEYHSSLDDLSLISPAGLGVSYGVLRRCLEILEANRVYRTTVPCEPQLGRRGLYPTLSDRQSGARVRDMMNVLAYCDGAHDVLALAERTGVDALDCARLCRTLCDAGVLTEAA
jgi:aminopeptidase-like protein